MVLNVARNTSWRRTISFKLFSRASTFRRPCSRMGHTMLYSVLSQHIVERHHVARLPLEANSISLVDFADVIHDRVFDLRAIPEVHVTGQIFAREDRE